MLALDGTRVFRMSVGHPVVTQRDPLSNFHYLLAPSPTHGLHSAARRFPNSGAPASPSMTWRPPLVQNPPLSHKPRAEQGLALSRQKG